MSSCNKRSYCAPIIPSTSLSVTRQSLSKFSFPLHHPSHATNHDFVAIKGPQTHSEHESIQRDYIPLPDEIIEAVDVLVHQIVGAHLTHFIHHVVHEAPQLPAKCLRTKAVEHLVGNGSEAIVLYETLPKNANKEGEGVLRREVLDEVVLTSHALPLAVLVVNVALEIRLRVCCGVGRKLA